MGMIEDLETAVLWLSSVTVRLVRSSNSESWKDGGESNDSKTSKQKRKRLV